MQKVGNAALTYEKTIKLTDDDGKTYNVINYRHYNKKRKSKQTGGVPDGFCERLITPQTPVLCEVCGNNAAECLLFKV